MTQTELSLTSATADKPSNVSSSSSSSSVSSLPSSTLAATSAAGSVRGESNETARRGDQYSYKDDEETSDTSDDDDDDINNGAGIRGRELDASPLSMNQADAVAEESPKDFSTFTIPECSSPALQPLVLALKLLQRTYITRQDAWECAEKVEQLLQENAAMFDGMGGAGKR